MTLEPTDNPEFRKWPKIPRFFETEIVVSEKIDGTNGLICIYPSQELYKIKAGSRNRWLSIDNDNFGFAKWVKDNSEELISLLGPGYHYGEWWGQGIQRTYDMEEKIFSLFNTHRWGHLQEEKAICDVVPHVKFNFGSCTGSDIDSEMASFDEILQDIHVSLTPSGQSPCAKKYGKEYFNVEGFMLFHQRANQIFKVPFNKVG